MKILFILHLPPPIHGAAMVGQSIQESPVINEAFDCHYINLSTSLTIDEIGRRGTGKLIRYFLLLGKVFQQLIVFKPHLCYLTLNSKGTGFYKDLPIALLAKLFGVKVVYHFHNKGISTRQHHFLDHLLYRLAFKNARVILLSKYLYPDIQKYVKEERVWYCANGVRGFRVSGFQVSDVSGFQGGETGNAEHGTPNILFLSNLIESKGVYVLLEACRILQSRQVSFHCTFVGGIGDISEQLFQAKVVALGLEDRVTYAGQKLGDEKEAEFGKSAIFVHPTFNDCFPLVLLEAMQHALPIVSTFEGAIPEIVEDGTTGFLVPQKDVQVLADKLEMLLLNPQLRVRMGEAGRYRYEQKYTLQQFENRFVEIINACKP